MKTREDVIATIQRLVADLRANPDSWENPSLERYLDAMGAWLGGAGKKHDEPPSWELVIQMLEAAKIYE
jgi:hypothetical protein